MQYLGGKSRLAKKFAPILIEALDQRGGRLYEPFVGGFNVVPALGDAVKEAHCSDIHPGLIALYRNLQIGWDPPENLSEEEYKRLRERCDWSNPLTSFAAFGCSFGGKEWGGYARNATRQNYAKASKNSLLKKKETANRCEFSCSSYTDVEPHDSVVYCDPPYIKTTKYKVGDFDHEVFYDWCEKVSKDNDVFVSEFTAPNHWEIVWELERKVTMRRDSQYETKIDRLYRPKQGTKKYFIPKKQKKKEEITFLPDLTLEADVSKRGILAVHRPVDPEERKRGYVITDIATLSVLCWVRRKADAVKLRNQLENQEDMATYLKHTMSHPPSEQ